MIAVDTSSFIAYLSGAAGKDVLAVEAALSERQVCLPPVVLSELLSDPRLARPVVTLLGEIPLLSTSPGYWQRVGGLRARVLALRRRAPLADALIAQSCLDHAVVLVTRDADFGNFARVARLRLVP
jgi:hypothetical protein